MRYEDSHEHVLRNAGRSWHDIRLVTVSLQGSAIVAAMEGVLNRIPFGRVALVLIAAYVVCIAASIGSLLAVAGARPLHFRHAPRLVTMPERLPSRTGT